MFIWSKGVRDIEPKSIQIVTDSLILAQFTYKSTILRKTDSSATPIVCLQTAKQAI